jgi:beta-N-acetylhexosaminidase
MNLLDRLSQSPFFLDESAIKWVSETVSCMTVDSKLRQLFALPLIGNSVEAAAKISAFAPGTVVRMPGPGPKEALNATIAAITDSKIPMLVAGDLEGGVNHPPSLPQLPNALSMAAANCTSLTSKAIEQLAKESRSQGFNWSFGPVIDINHEFRSAIVSTRSYGSDVERIIKNASSYVHSLQSNGMAATVKHWPGDGFDGRDQHLVTTVNPLSMNDWRAKFGRIYTELIDAGTMCVMSAHIALPAWAASCGVSDAREQLRPASVSNLLNKDLLRDELGFNGLIISDSAEMGGLLSWGDPKNLAVEIIQNGCDVLLFPVNAENDLKQLHFALQTGTLSQKRVDDAVTRVLALKAALGMHKESYAASTQTSFLDDSIDLKRKSAASNELAGLAVTLVHDKVSLLPISPSRYKRVVIMEQSGKPLLPGLPTPSIDPFIECLKRYGFDVFRHQNTTPFDSETADLLLYVFTQEAALTVSHIGIDWALLHGHFPNSMQRYWHVLPTAMISFGHPYFLYDAPDVPTYINAYSAIPFAQEAVARRLVGEEPFSGKNPIDPYCGHLSPFLTVHNSSGANKEIKAI